METIRQIRANNNSWDAADCQKVVSKTYEVDCKPKEDTGP